jgi:hypothetical protein
VGRDAIEVGVRGGLRQALGLAARTNCVQMRAVGQSISHLRRWRGPGSVLHVALATREIFCKPAATTRAGLHVTQVARRQGCAFRRPQLLHRRRLTDHHKLSSPHFPARSSNWREAKQLLSDLLSGHEPIGFRDDDANSTEGWGCQNDACSEP